jgi:PAS domain S-box-containing protein
MADPSKTIQKLTAENAVLKKRIEDLKAADTDRQLAEEALRHSEQMFRNLVENANEAIVVAQDGRVVYLNRQTTTIIGHPAEELLSRPFTDFIHPEDRHMFLDRHVKRVKGEDVPRQYEYRIVTKEGHLRWVDLNVVAINWSGRGATLYFLYDITGHKQAEDKLRESEERYRMLVDHSSDLIWRLRSDGVFSYVSTSWERILGYKPSFMAGKDFRPFVHPDDIAVCEGYMMRVAQGGSSLPSQEYRVKHESGDWKWHEGTITLVRDVNGADMSFVGISRDITERKRAEEALREGEERLQKQNDALLTLMSRGTLFQSNLHKAIAEITEVSAALIGTERVSVWLYNEDYSEISCIDLYRQSDHHHSSGEKLRSEEFPAYTANRQKGEVIAAVDVYTDPRTSDIPSSYYQEHGICSLLDAPVWMSDRLGALLRFEHVGDQRVWTSEDARLATNMAALLSICFADSDRRRTEEEKGKLQTQLTQAQKMESVGRLAGGVAHDFNNMLGVILGHTEMAMDKLDPSQPLYTQLLEIRKAAERSADLTRQLLAFARKQTIAPKVLDLNDTVEGMLKMLRRLIGEDIDLAWMPGKNLWPVKMDPSQIDQILANLSVNARSAIADVGKITIETQDITFDEAYCAAHTDFTPGEYVLLAVSDNGCGMDKETQSKLFEPFFTTKAVGEGTGLGLATVYGIVKQNNGFINVYSEPGHGTTFKIYLPRYFGKAEQIQAKGLASPAERGHETILLVEDEKAILKITTMMLEHLGYRVLAASTPGEAIRLAEQHAGELHLLMTDVVMPEMNGRDLARRLLSLYPDIKRLFMSGYTANVIAHHGVLEEGVHFIQKPFSIMNLADKLRETLDNV